MSQNNRTDDLSPVPGGETGTWQVDFESLIELLSTHLFSEVGAVIRELLANASDALTRRENEDAFDGEEGAIRLWLDSDTGRLFVRDNGIGMSKSDLKIYLATIAAGVGKTQTSLIGQFGIGFLSAFMVANKVTVETCKLKSLEGFRWVSLGKDSGKAADYAITPLTDIEVGTTVILDLKSKYHREWNDESIKSMVHEKASNFSFPIFWGPQGTTRLNDLQAPWYGDDPLTDDDRETIRKFLLEHSSRFATVESANEIIPLYADDVRGVVYVPLIAEIQRDVMGGVDLYSNRVFVKKSDVEIIPEAFRFVRGIVDCPKFRLTLNREDVFRDDNAYRMVRELIGTQIMEHFRKLANVANYHSNRSGKISSENKSEMARLRLQPVMNEYHIVFKHVLTEKTDDGRHYRLENDYLLDFENFMPFQSSIYAVTTLPDYLSRMKASGRDPEILFLHPNQEYTTYRAVADAEKREFILARAPMEEEYLKRYAQITEYNLVPAEEVLRREADSQIAPTTDEWRPILKFFQDRLDHPEINLTVSLAEFDPASVPGRLLTDKDSEGMKRWQELFEAIEADPTIDKTDPMFKRLDFMKQRIPYLLYLNKRNPVLSELARLIQHRVDVDMDVLLHTMFHDIAIASGLPVIENHLLEYQNRAYLELLGGIDARADIRITRSKLGEAERRLEETQNQVKLLVEQLDTMQGTANRDQTTNEVFFIRPMHDTPYEIDYISERLDAICTQHGLQLIDPKKLSLPGDILKEIIDYLRRSRLVVADVSEITNANVYYEVGFVYGSYPKKLILIAHRDILVQRLPFDIATQRVLKYEPNPRLFEAFVKSLENVIQELM